MNGDLDQIWRERMLLDGPEGKEQFSVLCRVWYLSGEILLVDVLFYDRLQENKQVSHSNCMLKPKHFDRYDVTRQAIRVIDQIVAASKLRGVVGHISSAPEEGDK